ncbi:hypothetical protein CEK25_004356 [Fusarium fujikuroi]|nr:hypothetical protein CEK25_004356 [Fusarium fujikuroi]
MDLARVRYAQDVKQTADPATRPSSTRPRPPPSGGKGEAPLVSHMTSLGNDDTPIATALRNGAAPPMPADALAVAITSLRLPKLPPSENLQRAGRVAPVVDIRVYEDPKLKVQTDTSRDLQLSVMQNRRPNPRIRKDSEKLKSVWMDLKSVMSELTVY